MILTNAHNLILMTLIILTHCQGKKNIHYGKDINEDSDDSDEDGMVKQKKKKL